MLRKAVRLGRADFVLLCHAAALHAAITVLIRVAPFGWTLRRLGTLYARRPRTSLRPPDVEAKIVWAVRTVTALLPAGSTCLTAAMTTHCLLRRGGCDSTIRFGVAPGSASDAPLAAHAWLETGHEDGSPPAVHGGTPVPLRIVIGGDTRGRYCALEPAGSWLL